jgi:hypothetical protein
MKTAIFYREVISFSAGGRRLNGESVASITRMAGKQADRDSSFAVKNASAD